MTGIGSDVYAADRFYEQQHGNTCTRCDRSQCTCRRCLECDVLLEPVEIETCTYCLEQRQRKADEIFAWCGRIVARLWLTERFKSCPVCMVDFGSAHEPGCILHEAAELIRKREERSARAQRLQGIAAKSTEAVVVGGAEETDAASPTTRPAVSLGEPGTSSAGGR